MGLAWQLCKKIASYLHASFLCGLREREREREGGGGGGGVRGKQNIKGIERM